MTNAAMTKTFPARHQRMPVRTWAAPGKVRLEQIVIGRARCDAGSAPVETTVEVELQHGSPDALLQDVIVRTLSQMPW